MLLTIFVLYGARDRDRLVQPARDVDGPTCEISSTGFPETGKIQLSYQQGRGYWGFGELSPQRGVYDSPKIQYSFIVILFDGRIHNTSVYK